nr:MAG TPA: hypothetical protein [Caudoviricetes sp.]
MTGNLTKKKQSEKELREEHALHFLLNLENSDRSLRATGTTGKITPNQLTEEKHWRNYRIACISI